MERHDKLQRLKQGEFPSAFSSHINDTTGRVEGCIKDMLSQGDVAVTVPMLKKRLSDLQESSS